MKTKQINEYIKKCHNASKSNGWWESLPEIEPKRSEWLADKIDLIASEGAEMVEAIREGRYADLTAIGSDMWDHGDPEWYAIFKRDIKDTFEDELADVFIRTCDLMGFYGQKYIHRDSAEHTDCKHLMRLIRLGAISISVKMFKKSDGMFNDSIMFKVFADIIKKCIEIAKNENIDLPKFIDMKLEYNLSRGNKHGKEF